MKSKAIALALFATSAISANAMHCPVCEPPNCTPNHVCHLYPEVKLADTFTVHMSPLGTDPEPGR